MEEDKPAPKEEQPLLKLSWKQLVPATLLVVLSMVDKVEVGKFTLSGGVTLSGLAALVLLYPLLNQLARRGGSTELWGLKLQVNSLEQKAEEEYGLRIEELRTDLEELRVVAKAPVGLAPDIASSEALEAENEEVFWGAVDEYRRYRDVKDWKGRVEVDKRLRSISRRISLNWLKTSPAETAAEDQEIQMALAVILGSPLLGEMDSGLEAARMLAELLDSPWQRTRYRAAQSIERRGRRSDTSQEAKRVMLDRVRYRRLRTQAQNVVSALEKAEGAIIASS